MITKKRQGSLLLLYWFPDSPNVLVKRTVVKGTLGGYFLSPTTFHVTNVFTEPEWRNQGVATALFTRLFLELRKNKVTHVTLDDCSDTGRCYLKLGFAYIEHGYPEMELKL